MIIVHNKKNKHLILVLGLILIGLTIYYSLGYLNSYFGYYGYDKDKYRRYSQTKEESIRRNVYVTSLTYSVDLVKIEDVFIERAYRWGSSSENTILLSQLDTLKNNNPEYPYQLVISFKEIQGKQKIYIPQSRILMKEPIISDTLYQKVFIRDSLNNLENQGIIKIWK